MPPSTARVHECGWGPAVKKPRRLSKTQRLLQSFASVELQPEHYNYGDEGPWLRDFGVAPSIAAALIRWGEQHTLVCTFEDAQGRSNGCHSWKPAFLAEAVRKHLELFGESAREDISDELLNFARRHWSTEAEQRSPQSKFVPV